MANIDSLATVRDRLGKCIAEIEARVPSLGPRAISEKMDAIRSTAAAHGLVALEALADYAAHHAMMPGAREATRSCMEHMSEALGSSHPARDRESILAALAVRLH